jgi:4-amino-4-deoxy-L-arabinose transferase-like glycosyltransferase
MNQLNVLYGKADLRLGKALLCLTLVFIAAMFLPRLVPMGMFSDGVLYASMARNLAEGRGSWWTPYFSDGYWTVVNMSAYYENPPMMLWIQSIFFRVFGDHWWVEKLFSIVVLAFNCFMLYRIWKIPFSKQDIARTFGWLPLMCFYLVPAVIWGSPNNLMDNCMLSFCLVAMYFILRALFDEHQRYVWMAVAGFFVFMGMLTKGPVALYPVTAPALYFIIVKRKKWLSGIAGSSLVGGTGIMLFVCLLLMIPAALEFFRQYWEQRLSVAIAGGRADGLHSGWQRLYIFRLLFRELSPLLVLTLVLWSIAKLKKWRVYGSGRNMQLALFFFAVGCCATLPILASTRQAGMYLIPGISMFALAAGYFHLPFFMQVFSAMPERKERLAKKLKWFAVLGLMTTMIYSGTLAGKPGREHDLLHDIRKIQLLIPAGAEMAVCDGIIGNFVLHTYLQRYHYLSLTTDTSKACLYGMTSKCDPAAPTDALPDGFTHQILDGELLTIYARPETADKPACD